jgi:Protein of unknown function (DUF3667)
VADVVDRACPSCGAPLPQRFCADCGEKRITSHDYSIVHFTEHLVESLTHFDIRSFRAVGLLAFRPGELTRAFLNGRRRRLVGPIQLFIIINVVFALLGANTFRTPLRVQRGSWMAGTKARWIEHAQEASKVSPEEFEHEFDRNAAVQAKTWIFMMIPAYALLLAVVYGFRRYFFEHLVFATHFMAFMLLWILAGGMTMGIGLRLAGVHWTGQRFDNVISLVLLAGMIVYLFLALRKAYGDRWWAALTRSLLLGAAFLPVLLAYRLMLFFVTLKTMH